jgi:L-asparaginase II
MPKRIIPAMYSVAGSYSIYGAQIIRMKSQAKKNMVNGLIAQFITRVKMTGLGALTAFTTSLKSICSIMGYIMAKRNIATGILTWATCRELRSWAAAGKAAPRPIPARMHNATHTVKYL